MNADSFTTVFGDARGTAPNHERILEEWKKGLQGFSSDAPFVFDTQTYAAQKEFVIILKELLTSRMQQGLPAIDKDDFTFTEGVCEEDNREVAIHVYFLGLLVGYAYTSLDRRQPRWAMHTSTLINTDLLSPETGLTKNCDNIYEQKRWLYAKSTTKTVFTQMVMHCTQNLSKLVDIPLEPFPK